MSFLLLEQACAFVTSLKIHEPVKHESVIGHKFIENADCRDTLHWMKPIIYQQAARKALMRMPQQDAKRLIEKIEQYAADPQSLANNVKALQGRKGIRLRVGDWRVIMEDGVVLDVLAIGNRSEIYR